MPDREKVIDYLKWAIAEAELTGHTSITLDPLKDALSLLREQEAITGETSDGYHTFNELYHHRAVLFSVIVRDHKDLAWKARKHHDGTMYDGMFIVGIETPDGQATYHYDLDPYWDVFECRELECAPEWDGHTPAQAIERIGRLRSQEARVLTAEEMAQIEPDTVYWGEGHHVKNLWPMAFTDEAIEDSDSGFLKDSYGRIYEVELYNKGVMGWRAWTSRPSPEQMRDMPWEGENETM